MTLGDSDVQSDSDLYSIWNSWDVLSADHGQLSEETVRALKKL